MKKHQQLLALLLLSPLAQAQVQLETVPASVQSGQPFMIQIAGVFPSPCSFDGRIERVDADVSGAAPVVTIDLGRDPDVLCGAQLVAGARAYGPFQIDGLTEGNAFELSLRTGTQGAEAASYDTAASATITVAAAAIPGLQPGTYWDPDFPGHGVSIERQGDALFAVLYSYDANQADTWLTLQQIPGAQDPEQLLEFDQGDCLVCGATRITSLPSQLAEFPVTLIPAGTQAALVRFAEEPGPALMLQPFSLATVDSSFSDFGFQFTLSDLSGNWVFAATDNTLPELGTVQLAQQNTSEASAVAFESVDGADISVICRSPESTNVLCDISLGGELLDQVDSRNVSHRRIDAPRFTAVRID